MATNTKPAAKTAAKGAEKPAEKPAVPSFAVEAADPASLKSTREEKPNPLVDAVKASLDNGKPLQVPVSSPEQATEVENYLRRAAKKLGCGLSMRKTATHVVFQGKATKRERKYTVKDVREWAKTEGASDDMLYPRVSAEVRAAFRKAHGLTKDENA